jgi:anion-transporting  ArsA/GET3 family ATPase
MEVSGLLAPRVLFVTGKGGVGKSTISAAIAAAGARSGRRTCLVEVEGRQTMSRLFDTQPWDFSERQFRPGLWGMSVDPRASFAEYMEMFYGAKRLSKIVVGSSAVDFATTAAPGIKDVLLVGKVKEIEQRRDEDGRFHYGLVVVDSPPTGRIVNFLRAPDATTEMVNVGPIRNQAQGLIDMLLDPKRTHLQLVTVLEEMPVEETVESAAALRELGVTLGPVVVNRVMRSRFDPAADKAFAEGLDVSAIARGLADARVDGSDDEIAEAAAGLQRLGETHRARLHLQKRMRERLEASLRLPTLELPYVASRDFGDAEIAELTEEIIVTLENA